MDPFTLAAVSAVATAGTTILGAQSEANVLEQQAEDEQQRAEIQAANAEKQALEERVVGQQKAGNRRREAKLAKSRLIAEAGASGASASDKTVLDIWGDIDAEGRFNADQEAAAADQKAKGITYQASLDRWTADRNAAIKRSSAKTTRIGGFGEAIGQSFGMMSRYGGFSPSSTIDGWKPTVTYG